MKKSEPAQFWLNRAAILRFAFVTAVLSVAVVAWASGEDEPQAVESLRANTPIVRVAEVERAKPLAEKRFYGTVRASEEAILAFPLAGRLSARYVDVGDRVTRGQLLARLDHEAFKNHLAAARAGITETTSQLTQVRREEARLLELDRAGAISTATREAAQTNRERTEASLLAREADAAEARRQLRDSHLYSTFDGTVTALHAERGEFVGAGIPVVAISGQSGFEVRLEVPESVALGLTEGADVSVHLPLAGIAGVSGTISRLGEATQGQTQLFPVHVALEPSPALRGGMTAEVSMATREAPGVSVPLAAILDPSGLRPAVLRLRSDQGTATVERVKIVPVRVVEGRAVIRGDLAVGDQVVTAGHAFLLDGDAVQVAASEASPGVQTESVARQRAVEAP